MPKLYKTVNGKHIPLGEIQIQEAVDKYANTGMSFEEFIKGFPESSSNGNNK